MRSWRDWSWADGNFWDSGVQPLVPEALRALPFLPSVESAYAQGYRRFVIDPHFINAETLMQVIPDSLVIAHTYASTVDELASYQAHISGLNDGTLLPWLIAAVAAEQVKVGDRTEILTDVYIGQEQIEVVHPEKVYDYMARNRTIRIEEQFQHLVKSGELDLDALREAGVGQRTLKRLLALLDTV